MFVMSPERTEALLKMRFIENQLQSPDTSLADLDYLLDLYHLAHQWLRIIELREETLNGSVVELAFNVPEDEIIAGHGALSE
jgi:hypothetical protein